MKGSKLLLAGALALKGLQAPAAAENLSMPEDRIYILHSEAVGGCPSLDWRISVQPSGVVSGLIAWDNMKSVARATGMVDRQSRTFSMTAVEIGGSARKATIDGQIREDGRLIANLRGERINCSAIVAPGYAGPPKSD